MINKGFGVYLKTKPVHSINLKPWTQLPLHVTLRISELTICKYWGGIKELFVASQKEHLSAEHVKTAEKYYEFCLQYSLTKPYSLSNLKRSWKRRNGSEMPDLMIKFSEDTEKSVEILKNYKMLNTSHSSWKS